MGMLVIVRGVPWVPEPQEAQDIRGIELYLYFNGTGTCHIFKFSISCGLKGMIFRHLKELWVLFWRIVCKYIEITAKT